MGLIGQRPLRAASDYRAGLLIVYLAAVSAVAFALCGLLYKHNPVSLIAVFSFLIPVFGVLCSRRCCWANRCCEWKNLAALVLVSFGIWLVSTTSRKPALA